MYSNQFLSPEKFDIRPIPDGTKLQCDYCSAPFFSRKGLFTSGHTIMEATTKKRSKKITTACPLCSACLIRFTPSYSTREEIEMKQPLFTTAISLRSPDWHDHGSIIKAAYGLYLLDRGIEKANEINDFSNDEVLVVDDEARRKVAQSIEIYGEWISNLERFQLSDEATKEEPASCTPRQRLLGDMFKKAASIGEKLDWNDIAVFPTIEFIQYLCSSQINVFDREDLVGVAGIEVIESKKGREA